MGPVADDERCRSDGWPQNEPLRTCHADVRTAELKVADVLCSDPGDRWNSAWATE